ncbi:membrane protein insertase YidC [Thermobifida halotolerans]|uniref:Membrane protein insertase YidC n=1 Tax=Thermobifida halotolerans TaxID=483545 RepID=A0A399FYK1_9ACTN|nr:membrane protein insertase YidC [Thermobifida halotolerans]UOE19252.1 membrane protein insertase YidC [Thermobifida halotolerans]
MYTFGPSAAVLNAAHTLTITVSDALLPVLGPASAAAAIVCLTLGVRLLLLPLSCLQIRGEKIRARLAPRLTALREQHGHNPERLLTETRKLYAGEGTSPLAGCLPALAQMPVFVVLYGLFTAPDIDGTANALLALPLAGVPLGSTLPQALTGGAAAPVLVFLALLALLAAVAWASRRWLTLPALAQQAPEGQRVPGMGVLTYLPYTTVLVAAVAPLAAGIYLVASTSWTVLERLVLRRIVRVD